MNNFLMGTSVFIVGEIAALLIFRVVKRVLGPSESSKASIAATIKGIVERLALFIGLLFGFPHILIAFAALKLGTRLHDEEKVEISNNYFLLGNLLSILIAMLCAIVANRLLHLP